MAILKVLVSFDYLNGHGPSDLVLDQAGNLWGATDGGGDNDDGTVFEIPYIAGSYANGPTTLVSFDGNNGRLPGDLTADGAGNLFGTTLYGGPYDDGTVFEIRHQNAFMTLASFDGINGEIPYSGVTTDAAGNLFGTTNGGGANNAGTVFEIAKTSAGYTNTLTTLVSFNGIDWAQPLARPVTNGAGDLFGTTVYGGAYGNGTVFDIPYVDGSYAAMPITLVSSQGSNPGPGQLMIDVAGDLFGTTETGGSDNLGTVFEVPRTSGGYGQLTILASFDGKNGNEPTAGLIADTAGDLFGTTAGGGASNDGTVFEIAKTDTGYATAPETLFSFDGSDGRNPFAPLIADATGNLFGTTNRGGPSDAGTVFELTDSGFVICFLPGTQIATPDGERAIEHLRVGDTVITLRGEVRPIIWIGEGRVRAPHGSSGMATPIIVRKGALADDVPYRDLHVTKGHSLYIDDVLIPVEFLVNHRSILWDDEAEEVTLYHIELASHDVLLANGAPAETYRDDGNRWLFHNASSGRGISPQPPCAPVLTGGAVVDTIWRQLLDRAGPRSTLSLTEDHDLHMRIDGVRVDAIERNNNMHVFRLVMRPRTARIRSRAAVPQELGFARDPRLLGVAVSQIVVANRRRQRKLAAADARLAEGFHTFEPDNGIRWTDGDAAVPGELFADMDGPYLLMLHLGGMTRYALPPTRGLLIGQ
jgi:uncharacterized repeat protein (TIGR03803 family)